MLALVAAVIAVLVAIGLGGKIARSISCSVQHILGDDGSCMTPPASNVIPCPTMIQTNYAHDEFQVLFIKAGNDHTLVKTVYSDGQVEYTLVNGTTLEAQAKLVQGEAQAGAVGFDAEITAAAGGELTGSHTFTFPNQQAANAFEHEVQSAGGWGAVVHDFVSTVPVVGGLGNDMLGLVGIHGAPSGSSLAQQYKNNLTGSYESIGAVVEVNAMAKGQAGPAEQQLGLELQAGGGARHITAGPNKGDWQIYLKLDGNGDAPLMRELFGAQASQVQGNAEAVVTIDPSGQPQQLQITADGELGNSTGGGIASPGASDPTGNSDGPGNDSSPASAAPKEGSGELQKLGFDMTDGTGQGYQYTGTLDLQNNSQAVQSLTELLNPATTAHAVPQLIHDFATQGQELVQPYHQTQSHTGVGVVGEAFDVGGGLEGDVNKQNQELNAGLIKNPGQPWQQVICQR